MGILDTYKKQNPEQFEKKENYSGSQTENIPVKVMSYDNNKVIGVRLDTKEEVIVKLKNIEQAENSKYKRPEIEDFANPKHKRYVKPQEGVILFESAKIEDGVYLSRWANCISSNPTETAVHILNCSLIFGKKKVGNEEEEWVQVRILFPEKKKKVSNIDELTNALLVMLSPNGVGSNPVAHIIINDGSEKEHIQVSNKRVEREDGLGKCAATGQDSTNEFLNSDNSLIIKDLIDNPELEISVIPGRIVYPGQATKEKMIELHPNAKRILKESFFIKKEKKDGEDGFEKSNGFQEAGYVKCSIATRRHADGAQYITHIRPIDSFPTASSVKEF
jgi:hypothetical protein